MLSKESKPYYKAKDLAKYIIGKCIAENAPISNLYLQKILYCIQKEFLKLDVILFEDDFEAWEFGPCIKDVYYTYCGFGGSPITILFESGKMDIIEELRIIIDNIVERLRSKEIWELAKLTEQKGGAWYITFKKPARLMWNDKILDHNIIPKELIQEKG